MPTFQMKAALAQIEKTLASYIGGSLARSSVALHTQKLNLEGNELTLEQADELLAQIAMGLKVFVGADKAESVTREISVALRQGGAA